MTFDLWPCAVCRLCSEDLHPVRRDVWRELRSGSGGARRHRQAAGDPGGREGEDRSSSLWSFFFSMRRRSCRSICVVCLCRRRSSTPTSSCAPAPTGRSPGSSTRWRRIRRRSRSTRTSSERLDPGFTAVCLEVIVI